MTDYTPEQLYAMNPDQLNQVMKDVVGVAGDYRSDDTSSQLIQAGKTLFRDQPKLNTTGLKVDGSTEPESFRQEFAIGLILAHIARNRAS